MQSNVVKYIITFNKAIVDIKLRPRCVIAPPTSGTIIDSSNAYNQASQFFLNLSPINAKLTSLSTSVHQSHWYISFSANVYRYHSNHSYATCVSVILPINRQISLILFYSSLRLISKQLVKIMPFNNRNPNYVCIRGKYVNLSEIHTAIRPVIELPDHLMSSTKPEVHNVSQRRRRRTELWLQAACTNKSVKIVGVVSEIHTQTYLSQSQYFANRQHNVRRCGSIVSERWYGIPAVILIWLLGAEFGDHWRNNEKQNRPNNSSSELSSS